MKIIFGNKKEVILTSDSKPLLYLTRLELIKEREKRERKNLCFNFAFRG